MGMIGSSASWNARMARQQSIAGLYDRLSCCTGYDRIADDLLLPIARFLGGSSAVWTEWLALPSGATLNRITYVGERADSVTAYIEDYQDADPVLHHSLKVDDQACTVWALHESSGSDQSKPRELQTFRRFLRQFDIADGIALCVPIQGTARYRCAQAIGIHRDSAMSAFASRQCSDLARIGPFVRTVLTAITARETNSLNTQLLDGLMDASRDVPVMVLDADLLISRATRRALALLGLHSIADERSSTALGLLRSAILKVNADARSEDRWVDLAPAGLAGAHLWSLRPGGRADASWLVHLAPHSAKDHASLRLAALTSREREVVDQIARGRDTAQLAHELRISHYTVQNHLTSIFRKTGVRSRAELLALLLHE